MSLARLRWPIIGSAVMAVLAASATVVLWLQPRSQPTPVSSEGKAENVKLDKVVPPPSQPPVAVSPIPENMPEKLRAFIAELVPDAAKAGVSRALLDRALASLEPDSDIFELMANQPEHVATPWDYLARLASDKRIETSKAKLQELGSLLAAIETKYGVDRHVVLAIWGIESNFGASAGNRHVVRSLATLAAGDTRRPKFWRDELLGALKILERGDIPLELMTGSWAGAMGHTQFMPTSYLAYAVDHDGDGRRDIWTSVPDALASTANYLKLSGWKPGDAWGAEVVLPTGFDFALARQGAAKPVLDWLALGLTPPDGQQLPDFKTPLDLLLPAGVRGPAFLVSPSFRAILRYNNAVPYALAVGHLADRMQGKPMVAGLWPTDDPPLNKVAREELQRRLLSLGHDIGAVDGVIGSGTRNAIRAYQQKSGLPEDGYAGERLLVKLRSEAK